MVDPRDGDTHNSPLQVVSVEDQLSGDDHAVHNRVNLDLRYQIEVMSKGHSQSGTGCVVVEGDGVDLSTTKGNAQHFSHRTARSKGLLPFGVVQL